MSPAATKIVAYYRVSTKKQGKSGLGLEGQQTTVAEYVRQHTYRFAHRRHSRIPRVPDENCNCVTTIATASQRARMCESTGKNAEKCFPQELIRKPGVVGSSPIVSTRANFRLKQVLLLPAGSSAYAVVVVAKRQLARSVVELPAATVVLPNLPPLEPAGSVTKPKVKFVVPTFWIVKTLVSGVPTGVEPKLTTPVPSLTLARLLSVPTRGFPAGLESPARSELHRRSRRRWRCLLTERLGCGR
jgi:hypothetical protein